MVHKSYILLLFLYMVQNLLCLIWFKNLRICCKFQQYHFATIEFKKNFVVYKTLNQRVKKEEKNKV